MLTSFQQDQWLQDGHVETFQLRTADGKEEVAECIF